MAARTILITGGTAGLGFYCAQAVAKQCPSYRIVVASRTDPNSAATTINKSLGQDNVEFMPLDLSSLEKVRTFAKEWSKKNYPPIIALVMNAGLQFPGGIKYSADGIELTFAINHLGHALLYNLLDPPPDARIVITSSGTHDPAQKTGLPDAKYTSAEELAHPKGKGAGRQRYATSKLVNVMYAYALNRRGRFAVAFDPGLMPGTGLARDANVVLRVGWHHILPHMLPLLRRLVSPNIHTPRESGEALAWLTVGEDVENGKYYEGRKQIKSSDKSYDQTKQDELWQWTQKICSS